MAPATMRLLLLLATLLATATWTFTRPREPTFDGHPVALASVGRIACVPRRFFPTPHEARQYATLRNADGSLRPVTPGRVALTAFLPELQGYSDEQYAEFVRKGYQQRTLPDSWVRIEILGESTVRFHADLDRTRTRSYDPVGNGVWRMKPDCVGKIAGAGAAMQLQWGPECVHWELREVRTPSGPAWLACYPAPSSARCDMATPQSEEGIHFMYDFDISRLDAWSSIDQAVRARVRAFAEAGRGIGFDPAVPAIDRTCD